MNIEERAVRRAAVILGCQVRAFPIRYLGLPLTVGALYCKDWARVIQKFDYRLARSKGRLHCYGGRLVFLQVYP